MILGLITDQTCLGASHPVLRMAPLLGFATLGVIFLIALSLFFALRRFRRRRDRIQTVRRNRSESPGIDPWAESARRMSSGSDDPAEPFLDDDFSDFGGRS